MTTQVDRVSHPPTRARHAQESGTGGQVRTQIPRQAVPKINHSANERRLNRQNLRVNHDHVCHCMEHHIRFLGCRTNVGLQLQRKDLAELQPMSLTACQSLQLAWILSPAQILCSAGLFGLPVSYLRAGLAFRNARYRTISVPCIMEQLLGMKGPWMVKKLS